MLKQLKLIILLVILFIFNSSNVNAANISLIEVGSNAANIYFEGKIIRGDSKKISSIIHRYKGIIVGIELDSLGGDVEEAIRIAGIVEKFQISSIVPKTKICGSACFFILIAGTIRMASGIEVKDNPDAPFGLVGIHRPFLAEMSSGHITKQQDVMRKVRDYLDNNFISRKLTDAMMSRPSNDAYWLTYDDLAELGEYSPALEEELISKCNYDRKNTYLNKNNDNDVQFSKKKSTINKCMADLWLDNYDEMKSSK